MKAKVKKKMKMDLPFKVGEILGKKNFSTFGRNGNVKPMITIERIRWWPNAVDVLINEHYRLNPKDAEILTTEEAYRRFVIWESSKNIVVTTKADVDTSCFRTDTGNPKYKWKMHHVQKVLFHMRMKLPDSMFEAYKCDHCEFYHIGKTVNPQNDIKNDNQQDS